MPRSLRVSPQYIPQVKAAVSRQGFVKQQLLAEKVGVSLSTVSNFLNGRPVDFLNFLELSQLLEQDWETISQVEAPPEPATFPETPPPDNDDPLMAESALEALELDCPTYIERPPIETNSRRTVAQPGSLLRIKAPRRMGKTWLIDRLLHQASQQDCWPIKLNLQQADQLLLRSCEEFLHWFCRILGRKLNLPNCLDDYWEADLGSSYNCTLYVEEHLLAQLDRPLVLALDNVDLLFPHQPIAQDFFPMLRTWHEEAKTRAIWRKLRLIVAHSTEVYIKLRATNSPFNVGTAIELPEFTAAQIQQLVQRQGLDWDAGQVNALQGWIGGHPHLVQRAIYAIKQEGKSLDEILANAATESGIYRNHLLSYYALLQESPQLAERLQQVVSAAEPIALPPAETFQLESLGLLATQGNRVVPRYRLYADYFRERLIPLTLLQ